MNPLEKIVWKLIINGSLTEQPGLFYGKTGIAVFFFHYTQYTGNELFREYAMDLIEETQKQISDTFTNRYDIGLSGIGVGFEYFLQNGFLGAENDNIFDDLDDRMYHTVMNGQYSNLSLCEGLTGLGRYFLYRLNGNCNKDSRLHEALTYIANEITHRIYNDTVPENEKYDVYRFLCDLSKTNGYTGKYDAFLHLCKKWNCLIEPDNQTIIPHMNNLQRLYSYQNYFHIDFTEKISLEWENRKSTDNSSTDNIGLLNGWTSEALLHLTFSNNINTSWINLL